MLGDQIGEVKDKIIGQRVLDIEEEEGGGGLPKIEYSFSANGRMKEIDITHMATFSTIPRGNGVLYDEGQGVITTRDSSAEMATEIGRGIGQFTDGGKKVKFRGSFFYRTSPTGRLAFLNNLVGVFEYEVDEVGNTQHKVWEWK
jgi:hypothetical protein